MLIIVGINCSWDYCLLYCPFNHLTSFCFDCFCPIFFSFIIIKLLYHFIPIQITVVLTTLCSPTPTTNLLSLLPAGPLRSNVQFYVTCIGKQKIYWNCRYTKKRNSEMIWLNELSETDLYRINYDNYNIQFYATCIGK